MNARIRRLTKQKLTKEVFTLPSTYTIQGLDPVPNARFIQHTPDSDQMTIGVNYVIVFTIQQASSLSIDPFIV